MLDLQRESLVKIQDKLPTLTEVVEQDKKVSCPLSGCGSVMDICRADNIQHLSWDCQWCKESNMLIQSQLPIFVNIVTADTAIDPLLWLSGRPTQ